MTKKVFVIDEESNPIRKIARFHTIVEAEDFIAKLEESDPEKVHRGGFGIDAPEKMFV